MNEKKDTGPIYANIVGNQKAPELRGLIFFQPYRNGTLLEIEVFGMPEGNPHPYALHIHEGNSCAGEDFNLTQNHYNPTGQLHPGHAGDLPPLFSNHGDSYMKVYTDRFTPEQVLGKTVVIHHDADDFITQPSGNSGKKIACGVIRQL